VKMSVCLRVAVKEMVGMENIKGVHRQHDHRSIQNIEVDLSVDDSSTPSVRELYRPVDGSNEQTQSREPKSADHELHPSIKHPIRVDAHFFRLQLRLVCWYPGRYERPCV